MQLEFELIIMSAVAVMASPGPATLAIANTSMTSGVARGLSTAAGILAGSVIWSVTAALGMGAIMVANAWLFEVIRYAGAVYLLYLAIRAGASALRKKANEPFQENTSSCGACFIRGLGLHLTNPKAIFFFGSLYALSIPDEASAGQVVAVILTLALIGATIFFGYAVLFACAPVMKAYSRFRRYIEAGFATVFFSGSIRLMMLQIRP